MLKSKSVWASILDEHDEGSGMLALGGFAKVWFRRPHLGSDAAEAEVFDSLVKMGIRDNGARIMSDDAQNYSMQNIQTVLWCWYAYAAVYQWDGEPQLQVLWSELGDPYIFDAELVRQRLLASIRALTPMGVYAHMIAKVKDASSLVGGFGSERVKDDGECARYMLSTCAQAIIACEGLERLGVGVNPLVSLEMSVALSELMDVVREKAPALVGLADRWVAAFTRCLSLETESHGWMFTSSHIFDFAATISRARESWIGGLRGGDSELRVDALAYPLIQT